MWAIAFIVAGIVLTANASWFAGAGTVGTVLLIFGIGWFALWILLIIIAAFGSSSTARRRRY